MLRAVILTCAFALAAVGCSSGAALPADADDEIVLGHEIFAARCARCHGPTGGGAIGPALLNVEDRLSDAEQLAVVVEGRKAMPIFANTLSEEEIAAVVRYTREIL